MVDTGADSFIWCACCQNEDAEAMIVNEPGEVAPPDWFTYEMECKRLGREPDEFEWLRLHGHEADSLAKAK